jgi:hypothetical protein
MRKRRSDRKHVLYGLTLMDTGDTYVGVTVADGAALVRAVKVRVQKHFSRAFTEDKAWTLCQAIRSNPNGDWRYEVLEVVRGRKAAHQRERTLIAERQATLNTF